MKPVRILGYRRNRKATLGRDLSLLVDEQPLVDLLEMTIPINADTKKWEEKSDARVVKKQLKKSIKNPGTYIFLTCAHCEMPEDILLSPCKVEHEGEYVIWKMKPPGSDVYFEEYDLIEFRFHKPQYEKTINKLMQNE